MPTNENTYNSRVTSEALEAKFRQVFPSQGGAELVDDLYASGVIQPVIDFSSVAEGSVLAANLQTAWDFSTGNTYVSGSSSTIINNTGFWLIHGTVTLRNIAANSAELYITDGLANKRVWKADDILGSGGGTEGMFVVIPDLVVFLRAGDSVIAATSSASSSMTVQYRQIADVNGNLTNPLGFVFS